MPSGAFMNPFQLFPITRLLHFGPYLCPEVCSSRPYMERRETEQKGITLAIQSFPLATSSKQGKRKMWFSLSIVGLNQVKGHFVRRRESSTHGSSQ